MAKYTTQILANAMRQLLREKKLDDITIQDLTDRAMVNRKTFYYHYHSLIDLINEMCTNEIMKIVGDRQLTPENWKPVLRDLLDYVIVERKDIAAVFSSRYAGEYRAHFTGLLEDSAASFIDIAEQRYTDATNTTLNLSKKQEQYLNEYYSMAIFGVLKIWFENGLKETPDEVMHMLGLLTKDNMYNTFRLMQAENAAGGQAANGNPEAG